MKKFFSQEIHENKTRTIGSIAIEALLNSIVITGVAVYVITLFDKPGMADFIKLAKKEPITTYFLILPTIIVLMETLMIGTAVTKLPSKNKSERKKNNN